MQCPFFSTTFFRKIQGGSSSHIILKSHSYRKPLAMQCSSGESCPSSFRITCHDVTCCSPEFEFSRIQAQQTLYYYYYCFYINTDSLCQTLMQLNTNSSLCCNTLSCIINYYRDRKCLQTTTNIHNTLINKLPRAQIMKTYCISAALH